MATSLLPILQASDVMYVRQRKTLNCCPFTDFKLFHLEAPSGLAEFLLFRVHLTQCVKDMSRGIDTCIQNIIRSH